MSENSLISFDARLVKAWLRGRSTHTVLAYQRDITSFQKSIGKALPDVTLEDVQCWFAGLEGSEATRRRQLAAVKSCLRFAEENRFIDRNVAVPVRPGKVQDDLHERILSEADVLKMIEAEDDPRRKAVLRTLYLMGLRNSEAFSLRWRDLTRKKQGGTASVFGKGGKTRHLTVQASLWKAWEDTRVSKSADATVLIGPSGAPLTHDAINRIVKRAAKRVGLSVKPTAHWFRHACASHAMDNGAPAHAVQAMLGHASLATTTRYTHVREGESAGNWLKG